MYSIVVKCQSIKLAGLHYFANQLTIYSTLAGVHPNLHGIAFQLTRVAIVFRQLLCVSTVLHNRYPRHAQMPYNTSYWFATPPLCRCVRAHNTDIINADRPHLLATCSLPCAASILTARAGDWLRTITSDQTISYTQQSDAFFLDSSVHHWVEIIDKWQICYFFCLGYT